MSGGLEIASAYGLRPVLADLTRRGVEVLRCRNANAAALRLASSALQLYEEMGDTTGRALALIEVGLLLERVGRPSAAQETLVEAFQLLPADDERSRFTALWALARIALRGGVLADAERHATAAAELVSDAQSAATGWVYRLQASIALQRTAPEQAEVHLDKAREIFETAAEPLGLALVAAELIRLQRQHHTEAKACKTAKSVLPSLLTSFVRNRLATRALTELLAAAEEKRLTMAAIDRVVETIEQADPEICWR